jgi:hypothetical protein
MEREVTLTRPAGAGSDPGACGADVEQVRASLDGILAEADRILDGLRPINAEDYLQQNRQRGGE